MKMGGARQDRNLIDIKRNGQKTALDFLAHTANTTVECTA